MRFKTPAAARLVQETAGGDLKRFMARKTSEPAPEPAERAREQCQRIEDIVTIEDAWDVVRRDEEIPKELKQRVGKVRGRSQRWLIRPLAKTYGIRTHYKKDNQTINEHA